MNSSYPSTSSLKRSISTPGTLFSLKSFTLEGDSFDFDRRLPPSGKNGSSGGSSAFGRSLNKKSPEELAKQLTLIDWSIFSCISRNELKPGQWTSRTKHVLSPNVVAFTRRFNILTFWISDEVLSMKLPKQRQEVISFFIKVANYLIDLKSLYSSYAIFCALTSEPIHRLEKTWALLNKKDRQTFEKMCDLFSSSDNSIKLRNFMEEAINSPYAACIPNLTTILRDIVLVDSYPSENEASRAKKLEWIYEFIEKCQQSKVYDCIDIVEEVYDYLNSFNYIEELQKFREDDYYKASLKLEPIDTDVRNKNKLYNGRFTSQYDISSQFYVNEYDVTFDVKTARNLLNKSLNEELFYQTKYQLQEQQQQQQPQTLVPFKPGHRKTNSLETNNFLLGNKVTGGSLNNKNVKKLNLIDDSPLDDYHHQLHPGAPLRGNKNRPTLEMKAKKPMNTFHHLDSTITSFSNDDDASSQEDSNEQRNTKLTYSHSDLVYSGFVSRKTILKVGKKPSITFWFNYYLGLSCDSLLFFSSKSNSQSNSFSAKPIKSLNLTEWSVAYMEDTNNYSDKKNVFTLVDKSLQTVYKIRTATEKEAREWVALIHKVVANLKNLFIV